MVDVSPRWITDCTIVEPRQNLNADNYEMARVAERIGCLARHVEELDVPIIAVESGALDRLEVSDLRRKWIALCGLYGGRFACVHESWVLTWYHICSVT